MKHPKIPPIDRASTLLAKYGLTEEAYKALEEAQNHRCKVCLKHKSAERYGILCVDHDHATGEVRGLLCDSCNKGLGHFKDNTTSLLRAIQYIKRKL